MSDIDTTDPDVFVTLRMPRSLRQKLTEMGKANYRTMAAEARFALDNHATSNGSTGAPTKSNPARAATQGG